MGGCPGQKALRKPPQGRWVRPRETSECVTQAEGGTAGPKGTEEKGNGACPLIGQDGRGGGC